MPFKNVPTEYNPTPMPNLPGSERQHYEREIRILRGKINTLVRAVKEMQEQLDSQ